MNKDIDFTCFCNAIGTLAELYDKELSEFSIAAYFETLKGYSIEDVEHAISHAMGTLKFFPKPVELIEIITGGGAQNIEDRAQAQALKVLETVRRVGGYSSVQFSDPVTTAVVKQGFGGWSKLCAELLEDQEKWWLKDFTKIYQAYTRQGMKEHGHLAGHTEIANSAKGYEFAPPILIGGEDEYKKLPN